MTLCDLHICDNAFIHVLRIFIITNLGYPHIKFRQLVQTLTYGSCRSPPFQVMTTLVAAFLGKFDFTSVAAVYGSQGILFLLVYLLTMIFLVINLFIALINEYIAMVKTDPRALPRDHEVITHFIETLKSLFERIRGGHGSRKSERNIIFITQRGLGKVFFTLKRGRFFSWIETKLQVYAKQIMDISIYMT